MYFEYVCWQFHCMGYYTIPCSPAVHGFGLQQDFWVSVDLISNIALGIHTSLERPKIRLNFSFITFLSRWSVVSFYTFCQVVAGNLMIHILALYHGNNIHEVDQLRICLGTLILIIVLRTNKQYMNFHP